MARDWSDAWAKVREEGRCRCATEECSGPLDPAHLVPRSRLPGPEADAASNIVPLCRLHHGLYDTGHLDLLPFLSHDEQAYAVFLVGYVEAGRYLSGRRDELRAIAMQAVSYLRRVDADGLADRLERAAG